MKLLVVLGLALVCSPAAFAQNAPVTGESADGRPVTERDEQPSIIGFDSADSLMNAAIDEARLRLPYFWERIASPTRSEGDFTLKVAFPVESDDGTRREHIWVHDIIRDEHVISATLSNEPNWMRNKHLGDNVVFSEDMISDWGFNRGEKMIGYYTLRVMVPDMPPEERAYFEQALGDNPQ